MADEAKVVPEQAQTPSETAPETPEAPKEESKEEAPKEEQKTVAELLGEESKPNMVPEAALIGEKKGRKEAERRAKELETQLQDLQTQMKDGATKKEISDDLTSLLDEYGLDDQNRRFFSDFASRMDAKYGQKSAKLEEKLEQMERTEKQSKFEQVFTKHYQDALDTAPEYKDIANPAVIKALSLDPSNKDKTFVEILEMAYGNAISGKRTIETTTPRGGKEPEPIDYDKAAKDPSYYKQIMSDPRSKEEYNKNYLDRLSKGF